MRKINTKVSAVIMSACLALSLATSCTASGSGSIGPNTTTPPVSQGNSQNNNSTSSGEISLAAQAQTALANYHNIDGAFHDSVRLSSSGQFTTQQLIDTVSDVVDTVSGGSDSSSSVDASASTSSSATVSGGSESDASSQAATTTTTATNVGTSTMVNTGVTSGVVGGTGMNSTSASLVGDLNLNTDINSDINSTMDSMQRLNAELRSDLESTGSVRFTEDNLSLINESNLNTNVNNEINSAVDNDLLSFNNSSILQPNGRLNFSGNVGGMTQIDVSQLPRTGDRGFTTSAGSIRTQANADGSVTRFFASSFERDKVDLNVLVADRNQGSLDLGSDLMLTETGEGFFTQATRVSSMNANGSFNVVTRATTNFDNGDRIEVLEERVVDGSGMASGNGTLTLTDANGATRSFDLRTMTNVDGSFVSRLNARDNAINELVLRENASGDASLSVMSDANTEESRANVDFNAMFDAMSNFDFS